MKKSLLSIFLAATVGIAATALPSGRVPESLIAAERNSRVHKLEAKAAPARDIYMTPVRTAATQMQSRFAVKSDRLRTPARKAQASRAQGNYPKLWGNVTYSDNWMPYDEVTIGMYTVPVSDDMNFELILDGPNGNRGGIVLDGVFYYHVYEEFMGMFKYYDIYGYDLETGNKVYEVAGPNVGYMTQGLAQDPTTGTIYGIFYKEDGSGMRLATIEYVSVFGYDDAVITTIGDLDGRWNALACDAGGQLYGIYVDSDATTNEVFGSCLCRIDKTTAAVEVVGETGQLPFYFTGATIDPKTNRMYWTVAPADMTGYLCEVNLTTGQASVIYQFPGNDEVTVLHIPAPEAEDKAPAAVADLAADFANGSLSGKVSFTAPSTLFDGTAATGTLNYSVRLNGELAASGTTTCGAQTSVDVTAPAAGSYEITVRVGNEVGESPVSKTTVFIGKGVPAGTAPVLTYDNGTLTLEWAAVTESADGGYIDPAAVTYTVTRYPGAVVVAEGLTDTEFSEEFAVPDQLTSISYSVAAVYDGKTSEAAMSNTVVLGNVSLPYVQTFDDATALDGYTMIDGNNDGMQWGVQDGAAFLRFNMSMPLDDWMFTPPMLLKKGMTYQVSFDAYASNASYDERLEVKVGKGTSVASMTTTVLAPTTISGVSPVKYSYAFSPDEDGTYSIGFHGISDADTYGIYVDNIAVEDGFATEGPASATQLKAVADPDGQSIVNISFTAPSKTYSGKALEAISDIKLLCGDAELKSFGAVSPGTTLSFVDTREGEGPRTYTVVCYSAAGKGVPASVTTYVGIDIPGLSAKVSFIETSNEGEVTVSWDAISADRNGNAINPDKVKYNLYSVESGNLVAVAEGLTATTHTFKAVADGTQKFAQFAVTGVTNAGEGQPNGSDMRPVGTPYTDIRESFAGKQLGSNIWGMVRFVGQPNFSLFDEAFGFEAADADHGYFGLQSNSSTPGECGAIFSGKIAMPAAGTMGVSFYVYCNDTDDANQVEVFVAEGNGEFRSVGSAAANSEEIKKGWNKFFFDLGAYAGKVICVQIAGTIKVYDTIMLDNIHIGQLYVNDLVALSMGAPVKVRPGNEYTVDVKVFNDGLEVAKECVVALYAGGEKVAESPVGTLRVGEIVSGSLVWAVHPLEDKAMTLYATAEYPADEVTDNNSTEANEVAVVISNLPGVTDLAGAAVENGADLTWSKPDITDIKPEQVEESFEEAEPFTHEYDGWLFVDVDQSPVGGSYMFEVPGIITNSTCSSFFVFDGTDAKYGLKGHTGDKFLASFFRYDGGQVDDWAISPELSGNAQTISFYARSYMSYSPETIEVYYSTGSTELSEFVAVKNATVVPEAWTLYTAELPAGAKRFAIRSCAVYGYFLFVDDFTFEAAPTVTDLTLLGFDVYEGRNKVNSSLVADSEYHYTSEEDGTVDFTVVTVYDQGISPASNIVTVTLGQTGVAEIESGITIARDGRRVTISGAEGLAVAVYALDGKTVFSGTGSAVTSIELSAGTYIVTAGKKTVKLIIL